MELLNTMAKAYNDLLLLTHNYKIGSEGWFSFLIDFVLSFPIPWLTVTSKIWRVCLEGATCEREDKERENRQIWTGRDIRSTDYNKITLLPL